MSDYKVVFLKLGGSLITDKTQTEHVRSDVLYRLAGEIKDALSERPDLRLVLGHGSGSFGHVVAAQYDTRDGVELPNQWRGFAQVSSAASRLNKLVWDSLLDVGLPALTLQPSASAIASDGTLISMATKPIQKSLEAGLIPIVHGDVAFDTELGGTIISTEQILSYLAGVLTPTRLLLAGETSGVLDEDGHVIARITSDNISIIEGSLKGSRGTDVTGGMSAKVHSMLALTADQPQLVIEIFSGMVPGNLKHKLTEEDRSSGTIISSQSIPPSRAQR